MKRATAWRLAALVGAVVLTGCVTVTVVDGFEVYEDQWNRDRRSLLSRAAFDLSCPEDQIVLKILNSAYGEYAGTVGAMGCDKKATYLRVPYTGTWSMDSSSSDMRPAQVAPAP
jgi:hypothetical protein